jgi:hypothetical protein
MSSLKTASSQQGYEPMNLRLQPEKEKKKQYAPP